MDDAMPDLDGFFPTKMSSPPKDQISAGNAPDTVWPF